MGWTQLASHDSHPWLADRRSEVPLARRVSAAMLLGGGLAQILSISSLAGSIGPEDWVPAAILVAYALLVLVVRGRARWLLTASPIVGVAMIGLIIHYTPPLDAAPYFYVWPVLFAAYFLGRRWLIATIAAAAVSLGFGLAAYPLDASHVNIFVQTVLALCGAGTLVLILRERQARIGAQLVRDADADTLTGLLNRRAFQGLFARVCAYVDRSGDPMSVALFDLDQLRRLNDEQGRAAGDAALSQLADRLAAEARASDVVARLGGPSFAVLLTRCDADGARVFGERARSSLRDIAWQGDRRLTVSCGIAEYRRGITDSVDVIGVAETAVRTAKAAGRDRVVVGGSRDAMARDRLDPHRMTETKEPTL